MFCCVGNTLGPMQGTSHVLFLTIVVLAVLYVGREHRVTLLLIAGLVHLAIAYVAHGVGILWSIHPHRIRASRRDFDTANFLREFMRHIHSAEIHDNVSLSGDVFYEFE